MFLRRNFKAGNAAERDDALEALSRLADRAARAGGMPELLGIEGDAAATAKRWRRVFKLMHGYGRWLQLSVFQCRLSARRRAEMARRLEEAIHGRDDHVLILDLGPADRVDPRVESLGKSFTPVTRSAVVI